MIINKLLFIFTKEIKCKFYDGQEDAKYSILANVEVYKLRFNTYGAAVEEMLTMTYSFSDFKDLVNSIDY